MYVAIHSIFPSNTDTYQLVLLTRYRLSLKILITPLQSFQYHPTCGSSTKWTDTSPALSRSYLLQRDNRHHWVPRTIVVVYTIYIPHPMIHTSHDTSHASASPLQYIYIYIIIIINFPIPLINSLVQIINQKITHKKVYKTPTK